ncbi:MFS transporter [Leucobacter sp. GX24907]
MGIYRDLGRHEGVLRVVAGQVLARLPFGMLSIIMLLHMSAAYGDYTSAGIVLAAQSIGQAVSGPLAGRLMGHLGMRPVLTATSIICSGLLVLIAVVHLPLLVVGVIAACIGITTPPISPAVRTAYPRLVPGNQLSALFSLDAAAQEIIWVLGPVIAVFVSAQASTTAALIVAAVFMLGGGIWFVLTPAIGRIRVPRPRRGFGAVLKRPTVVTGTVASFLFVASFAAIEAGIVAAFGEGSLVSGLVLAVFAGGSLIGGLLIGTRQMRPWSMLLRVLVVLLGTALCLVSLNPWWLSTVLFIAGLGTAPVFAGVSTLVSATVKFSETAEAYGWIGTGQLVGVAVGSAVAGITIDQLGAHGAVLASTAFLAVTAIYVAASIPLMPDLKGRDIAPPPDTEPNALPLN